MVLMPGVLLAQAAAPDAAVASPGVARVSQVVTFAQQGGSAGESGAGAASSKTAKTAPVTMAGGTVSTAAGAATSLVLGGLGTARLQGEGEVKVPPEAEGAHSLELVKGSLFLNVDAGELKKKGPAEFKLRTPASLLAVKGTRFFATARGGEEVIGVHEGKVVVQDVAGKASVEITDGMAVPVSGGSLGEVRPMTSDEQATRKEYDLASLTANAMPPTIKWSPLETRRVAGGQKADTTPEGNTRFTWPLGNVKSLTYLKTEFWYDLTAEEAQGVAALEIRLRVVGAESVSFHTDHPVRLPTVTLQSPGAGWQTVIVPFPGHHKLRPAGYSQRFGLTLMPALRSAGDSLKSMGAVEIEPIKLLKAPSQAPQ